MSTATERIPTTPRLDKVIIGAELEALRRGDAYVGTEHLLLAIALNGAGRAHEILSDAKLTPARINQRLKNTP